MSKNKKNENNITLDSKHNEIVKTFKTDKKNLPQKKDELASVISRLDYYKNKDTHTLEIYEDIIELDFRREELETEIAELEEGTREKDYFLRTNSILLDYYQKNHQIKNNSEDSDSDTEEVEIKDKKTVDDFLNIKGRHDRATILNNYLSIVDPGMVSPQYITYYTCDSCGCDLDLNANDGYAVCESCGFTMTYLYSSDKPTYKDSQPEIASYSYKRINHFVEWLNQFQAKESTSIPDDVFDQIYEEIKKHRIKNLNELTHKMIREFLKKLKLNKYYEHTTYIINRLNGKGAPCISRDVEEKLKSMFREIQAPFMRHCPENRKNFLSYSYVLHKFVELLSIPELKQYFPLLKSRQKLIEQDKIWCLICQDLEWEFIPSI
jgi:hypothetical protein